MVKRNVRGLHKSMELPLSNGAGGGREYLGMCCVYSYNATLNEASMFTRRLERTTFIDLKS